MENDLDTIVGLVACFFVLLVLFVIIRGFRLPASFYEKERKRAAMRTRLVELELAEKEVTLRCGMDAAGDKKPAPPGPGEKAETAGRNPPKGAEQRK